MKYTFSISNEYSSKNSSFCIVTETESTVRDKSKLGIFISILSFKAVFFSNSLILLTFSMVTNSYPIPLSPFVTIQISVIVFKFF